MVGRAAVIRARLFSRSPRRAGHLSRPHHRPRTCHLSGADEIAVQGEPLLTGLPTGVVAPAAARAIRTAAPARTPRWRAPRRYRTGASRRDPTGHVLRMWRERWASGVRAPRQRTP